MSFSTDATSTGVFTRTGGRVGHHEWPHFVARSGPEGLRWVEEYRRPEPMQLLQGTDVVVKRLRRGKIREGKASLEEMTSRLDRLADAPASIFLVLKRFYLTARAYYHYCVEELDRANEDMIEARRTVAMAVETAPFLLPLANHCHEFRLQQARVARKRRRWREMNEHVRGVRAMLLGLEPLCTLNAGQTVHFSAVADFYRSIPSLSEDEIASIRFFLDDDYRREGIERFLMTLFVLPGVVIPYP